MKRLEWVTLIPRIITPVKEISTFFQERNLNGQVLPYLQSINDNINQGKTNEDL